MCARKLRGKLRLNVVSLREAAKYAATIISFKRNLELKADYIAV